MGTLLYVALNFPYSVVFAITGSAYIGHCCSMMLWKSALDQRFHSLVL